MLVRNMAAPEHLKQLLEKMPNLKPDYQVMLLANLAQVPKAQVPKAQVPKTTALSYIKTAAKAQDQDVRMAALSALGVWGDASCVELLASSASVGPSEIKRTARDSLYQISGEGVDEEIVRLIRDTKEL